ncbi:hypothetical protein A5780_18225 [Nocardia sp. 852002-20019_SCH5090214]|uniref:GNAT family N-acetyltransferase n=1 Tax=Nocardia nova TaxID=37330 RepID=A0A2S6A9G7_9NOCA|nr:MULTISPECIES: hypothetical protein [Nocardia]OBF69447.1 hypothetical protein A9X06_04380 [Mycobacterium sp. 852002-51759_SCH5129042]MBF6274373.1 hypothetical protein [Nocardia nova]MBV7704102.1 hypothetical protein [Nocardia nova]OBA54185.1 hypothetical protein A5789_01745 [Nocardia sp. 852002-51101_SCH5132738]OBA62860.1 hypothetical protein A5780_18225 [Nocardia sp. 852002-20019_SCH5090214]
MKIIEAPEIGPTPALDEAWTFYRETFTEINAMAAQRHLMRRDEFIDVMGDERIVKYLLTDDDNTIVGLGVSTNDLEAWPLISPAYFRRIYPAHFAARTLWYIGFIGVRPDLRGGFAAMLEAMSAPQRDAGGIALMDYCAFNVDEKAVLASSLRILGRYSEPRLRTLDTQTFVAYEFGER